MSRDQQYAWLFVLASAAIPTQVNAAVVTQSTVIDNSFSGYNGNGSETIYFVPIVGADELLSISDGYVQTIEGGSFQITADFLSGNKELIYSTDNASYFNLNQVPVSSFQPGTLTGLTFSVTSYEGEYSVSIPSGTTFSFNSDVPLASAVPELPTWAMMIGGLALVGGAMRQRKYIFF